VLDELVDRSHGLRQVGEEVGVILPRPPQYAHI